MIFRKSREKTLVLENLHSQMARVVSGADSKEMPWKKPLRSHQRQHKCSKGVARDQACWLRCPELCGLLADVFPLLYGTFEAYLKSRGNNLQFVVLTYFNCNLSGEISV